jgi:hypothetical protein
MSSSEDEKGILAVLMDRFESQRLPRALALKARVDQGECLDEFDLAFMHELLSDSLQAMPMLERHPEFEQLAGKVASLYREIAETALANEQKAAG